MKSSVSKKGRNSFSISGRFNCNIFLHCVDVEQYYCKNVPDSRNCDYARMGVVLRHYIFY